MFTDKTKAWRIIILLLTAFAAAGWLLLPGLQAGSRLGKVTGVMGEVIAINLGSIHGVRQGLRGMVFEFDEDRNTLNVADMQVIAVSEESCLARVVQARDSLKVGQFVDIEGTLPPRTFERVDVVREMEENARNYFAAYQYTEPDSANCLAECNRILARDPENRLVPALKSAMVRSYYQWANRERNSGRFAYALIYYFRVLKIDPEQQNATENIWDCLDLIDTEAQVGLGVIRKGSPPDYYYALAEQYYRNGQFDKSKKYFQFLLDNVVQPDDMAAKEGLRKNDRMLKLVADLSRQRREQIRKSQEEEQKKKEKEVEKRRREDLARYYRVVADDLFRKKDLEGALVYYLKLLELFPDDSLSLARQDFISKANMVLIPAGEFSFGSNSRELGETMLEFRENRLLYREIPKRWVFLDSFYIDRYEVVNRQYKRFLESTGNSPPISWKDGSYPEGEDDYPVVYVSWDNATKYARWIGKRLPTEQEWEKAARGSSGFRWPWGDRFLPNYCNTREAGYGTMMPVGSFLGGANEFGVMDLAGNVWEWVNADLKPYPGYTEDSFYFTSAGGRKVMRGGSFMETGDYARGAFRGDGAFDMIYNNVGFRCARDVVVRQESLGGL
ncbi:MAG: formylglycine-generating enzyme family protein [Candidatus Glassbacteria bacterium]|nr:formylglycine-generating enzyme family protein [Candidatus Glassbacteria bacterium]